MIKYIQREREMAMNYSGGHLRDLLPVPFSSDSYWWMPEKPEQQVKELFRAYARFALFMGCPMSWPRNAIHFQYFSGRGLLKDKDEHNCESHCVVFWISNAIRRCMLAKPNNYHEKNYCMSELQRSFLIKGGETDTPLKLP